MIAGIMIGALVSSLIWACLSFKENIDWCNYCKKLNDEWADRCKNLINESFDFFYKAGDTDGSSTNDT